VLLATCAASLVRQSSIGSSICRCCAASGPGLVARVASAHLAFQRVVVRPDSRATGEVAIRLRTMRAAGAAAPQHARADHAAGDLRPLRALAYDVVVHANCLLSTSMPQPSKTDRWWLLMRSRWDHLTKQEGMLPYTSGHASCMRTD
jgi:hypothetical protein